MVDPGLDDGLPALSEADMDPDPFKQFGKWFEQANGANIILPNAMTLATVSSDGKPSARMVLLKEFDESGFVFYTNYDSPKGRELEENTNAALVFYWAELGRQVRITGRAERVSREQSEAYFRTRPLDSRLSAWVSNQSQVISSREVLEEAMARLAAEYQDKEVPLPPYWGGLRVSAETIEFWQSRPGRLHDRLRYTRQASGGWLMERLSP
jgi:pyridoxamine 5'-phosphate oxidase